jgi:transcriptional/translational regulatory protein YebC/TACO1
MELFELVAEAGAEDLTLEDDTFVVMTPVENFGAVQAALQDAGTEIGESQLVRIPTTLVSLDADAARKVGKLLELLEELQDVQAVYSTLNFDESTIEALS